MIYEKCKSITVTFVLEVKKNPHWRHVAKIRFISTQKWPRSGMKMSDCDFYYQKQICVTTVMETSPYFI